MNKQIDQCIYGSDHEKEAKLRRKRERQSRREDELRRIGFDRTKVNISTSSESSEESHHTISELEG